MKMLVLAVTAFSLTAFVGAEEKAVQPTPVATQAEQEALPIGSPVQTFGKVTSLHSAQMVGVTDPHTIVKLEDDQGDVDIVDLGSTAQLKANGVEPKEGQKLWIDGRVGKINDKFLIVAEQLSETRMVTIARTAPLREETVKHAEARSDGKTVVETAGAKDPKAPKTLSVDAGQQVRTVEGTVIHTRRVKIEGETDEHILAKIQTENGIAVIDMGSCPAMPSTVDLTEGKMVVATGSVGQLNGKPIILADSVGNMSAIQRRTEVTPVK